MGTIANDLAILRREADFHTLDDDGVGEFDTVDQEGWNEAVITDNSNERILSGTAINPKISNDRKSVQNISLRGARNVAARKVASPDTIKTVATQESFDSNQNSNRRDTPTIDMFDTDYSIRFGRDKDHVDFPLSQVVHGLRSSDVKSEAQFETDFSEENNYFQKGRVQQDNFPKDDNNKSRNRMHRSRDGDIMPKGVVTREEQPQQNDNDNGEKSQEGVLKCVDMKSNDDYDDCSDDLSPPTLPRFSGGDVFGVGDRALLGQESRSSSSRANKETGRSNSTPPLADAIMGKKEVESGESKCLQKEKKDSLERLKSPYTSQHVSSSTNLPIHSGQNSYRWEHSFPSDAATHFHTWRNRKDVKCVHRSDDPLISAANEYDDYNQRTAPKVAHKIRNRSMLKLRVTKNKGKGKDSVPLITRFVDSTNTELYNRRGNNGNDHGGDKLSSNQSGPTHLLRAFTAKKESKDSKPHRLTRNAVELDPSLERINYPRVGLNISANSHTTRPEVVGAKEKENSTHQSRVQGFFRNALKNVFLKGGRRQQSSHRPLYSEQNDEGDCLQISAQTKLTEDTELTNKSSNSLNSLNSTMSSKDSSLEHCSSKDSSLDHCSSLIEASKHTVNDTSVDCLQINPLPSERMVFQILHFNDKNQSDEYEIVTGKTMDLDTSLNSKTGKEIDLETFLFEKKLSEIRVPCDVTNPKEWEEDLDANLLRCMEAEEGTEEAEANLDQPFGNSEPSSGKPLVEASSPAISAAHETIKQQQSIELLKRCKNLVEEDTDDDSQASLPETEVSRLGIEPLGHTEEAGDELMNESPKNDDSLWDDFIRKRNPTSQDYFKSEYEDFFGDQNEEVLEKYVLQKQNSQYSQSLVSPAIEEAKSGGEQSRLDLSSAPEGFHDNDTSTIRVANNQESIQAETKELDNLQQQEFQLRSVEQENKDVPSTSCAMRGICNVSKFACNDLSMFDMFKPPIGTAQKKGNSLLHHCMHEGRGKSFLDKAHDLAAKSAVEEIERPHDEIEAAVVEKKLQKIKSSDSLELAFQECLKEFNNQKDEEIQIHC